jgi:hypothetical protein
VKITVRRRSGISWEAPNALYLLDMGKQRRQVKSEPLVILVGSGVHKEILQKEANGSPLACWSALLRETARRAEIPLNTLCGSSLTAAWESMVLHALVHGFRDAKGSRGRHPKQNAAEVDHALRRVCTKVIVEESEEWRGHYQTHWITQALRRVCEQRQVHLVEFNFDELISGALGVRKKPRPDPVAYQQGAGLTKAEHSALFRSWQVPGNTNSLLWKPHGWIGQPKSLRLGLRDFGLQGAGYRWAFGFHKADQRRKAGVAIAASNTWVARVMRHECRAIGLGLGPDEWGLHWLLTQRAREHAKKVRPEPFTVFRERRDSLPLGTLCAEFYAWPCAVRAALSE